MFHYWYYLPTFTITNLSQMQVNIPELHGSCEPKATQHDVAEVGFAS